MTDMKIINLGEFSFVRADSPNVRGCECVVCAGILDVYEDHYVSGDGEYLCTACYDDESCVDS